MHLNPNFLQLPSCLCTETDSDSWLPVLYHLQLAIAPFAFARASLSPQRGEGLRVRGERAQNGEISNWNWYYLFIRVHSPRRSIAKAGLWSKKTQKSRFFVSRKQNFYRSSHIVRSCKRIASAAQRRSTGTPGDHQFPVLPRKTPRAQGFCDTKGQERTQKDTKGQTFFF